MCVCRGGFGPPGRRPATPLQLCSISWPPGCQKKSGCLWLLAHGEPRLPPFPLPPQASSFLGLAGTELGRFVTTLSVRTGGRGGSSYEGEQSGEEKDAASLGPRRGGAEPEPPMGAATACPPLPARHAPQRGDELR